MSRLIDAEDFGRVIREYCKDCIEHNKQKMDIVDINADIQDFLDNQPIAFDVDKVVVQLETQSEMNLKKGLIEVLPDEARPYLKAVESYDKAIEIVKRGGIDENKKDN